MNAAGSEDRNGPVTESSSYPPAASADPSTEADGSIAGGTHPGGPVEGPPANGGGVRVTPRLPAPGADVADQPVAALGDALCPGDVGGHGEQVAEERPLRLGGGGDRPHATRARASCS